MLAQYAYGDFTLRGFQDLDLFVARAALPGACELLEARGFRRHVRPRVSERLSQEEYHTILTRAEVTVELYCSPGPATARRSWDGRYPPCSSLQRADCTADLRRTSLREGRWLHHQHRWLLRLAGHCRRVPRRHGHLRPARLLMTKRPPVALPPGAVSRTALELGVTSS